MARSVENGNIYVTSSSFSDDQRVTVGHTLFSDFEFIYKEDDFFPLREQYQEEQQRLRTEPTVQDTTEINYLIEQRSLSSIEGCSFLAVRNVIEGYDGGILLPRSKGRNRMYDYAHEGLRPPVMIADFKGKALMTCAEVAIIAHDLLSHDERFVSTHINGMFAFNSVEEEGHAYVIVRGSQSADRYILLDQSIHISIPQTDEDEKASIPFCQLLTREQISDFEQGSPIVLDHEGKKMVYDIGLPYNNIGNGKFKLS